MEALSSQHSVVSQKQNQQQNQDQTPTTETQRHGEEESLPRMGADERELGMTRKPVEWRPPTDVFRMDTREGMEAYEASLRMKIKLGERIPAKAETSSVELPGAATKSEAVSGSFDAPSLALPLRLAQDDKCWQHRLNPRKSGMTWNCGGMSREGDRTDDQDRRIAK